MRLKIKKLHPDAILPVYASEGAAGMDLFARLDFPVVLHPGECARIPTGIAIELPANMEAQVRGRSGLAFNHAIFAYNGTIDADFRGEIKALLVNLSKALFTVQPGMRVAQMIVNAAVVKCRPEFVDELDGTARGEKGFGSTGLESKVIPMENAHLHLPLTNDDPEITGPVMSPGYVRYNEAMGDTEVDQADILQRLSDVSQGKR